MDNVIELKILPEYFKAQISGDKNFEIRKNDRYFDVGQHLKLREWNDMDVDGIGCCAISSLEGYLKLSKGDWIATGSKGEHWAIRDDIFKKTYEEVKPKGILYYTSQKKLAKFLDSYGLTVVSNELATKILKLLSDDQ